MTVKENVLTQKQVDKLTKEQEEVTGATEKLRDLGGLKVKFLIRYLPLLKSINSFRQYGMSYLYTIN